MSTSTRNRERWGSSTVLLVGVGGLGCPAASVLAEAGVGRLLLLDDDVVEVGNLHRQVLFDVRDVGADKAETAARRLQRQATGSHIEAIRGRLLPDSARGLVRQADLVVEGADNFATKFLAADACHLEGVPVIHGAAIRWRATAWAVGATGRPCYRCLFEDLPAEGAQLGCSTAGVIGPVVGLAGALMADLALRLLAGDPHACGWVHTYDGLEDRLRSVEIGPRPECALCGMAPTVLDTSPSRYIAADRAA